MQVTQPEPQATRKSRRARLVDRAVSVVFLICAILLVAIILSVIFFLASQSYQVFFQGATLRGFFFGTFWDPTGEVSGGAPSYAAGGLILGSVITTLCAMIIVIPLAIGTAVFFTEAAPTWVVRIMQKLSAPITGNIPTGGYGWATAIVVLVIMVLPTTMSISIDSLRAVPGSVREASLALGSTRWQLMYRAVIPACITGLGTAVVLGFTRAIGEALAVALVLGGSQIPNWPWTLAVFFQPNVNITQQIAANFQETAGTAQYAYWTLAFVLLVITFIFVSISHLMSSRSVYK